MRYGLYACAYPLARSGVTFIRHCSHVSVAIHAYAIATQATNQLLWQDFHLQVTEQLPMRSERDIVVRDALVGVLVLLNLACRGVARIRA